ncbi:hypothetical protein [Desulfosarcina variabilis]|uniref:hypothetical protein n=1 Tax=Desulfosarcina variabilis TaxID=2300 RepID=UPI003AFB782A
METNGSIKSMLLYLQQFGVYGLLALGLTLVVLRRLYPQGVWREGPLRLAFWSMNGGLVLMIALSLLPIGLMQTWASIEHGLWYARSAEFLQQPIMEALRWLRTIGDTVFLIGVGALAYFVIGLITGWSYQKDDTIHDVPVNSIAKKQPV